MLKVSTSLLQNLHHVISLGSVRLIRQKADNFYSSRLAPRFASLLVKLAMEWQWAVVLIHSHKRKEEMRDAQDCVSYNAFSPSFIFSQELQLEQKNPRKLMAVNV